MLGSIYAGNMHSVDEDVHKKYSKLLAFGKDYTHQYNLLFLKAMESKYGKGWETLLTEDAIKLQLAYFKTKGVLKPTIEGLHVNDIIEIISGPFKGSRAKINRIDVGREEVTVELLDSQIPIPIKLHSDFCKVIESAAGEKVVEELTMVERSTSEDEVKSTKEEKEEEEEEEDVFSEFFKTN